MAYQASGQPDRVKAMAAVVAVHAGLAALILGGLHMEPVRQTAELLKMFDIRNVVPPPPEPPPPRAQAQRARREEGAAGKKAEPTPVIAPRPEIELRVKSPVPAAPVAGTGSATSAGASTSGTGTGAGGSGTGRGGGGLGDLSGFTPARIVRRIPDSEYRRISAGRILQGSATISFRVNPDGRMSGCRIVRSSGDPLVDSTVCDAATRNMSFSPARDPAGRPVAQDMTYTPIWRPNRW